MDDELTAHVVAIASEVFGRPARPGDTFFDLGGDSLLGVVCALRMEEEFGIDVGPGTIMRGASLAEIAAGLRPAERA